MLLSFGLRDILLLSVSVSEVELLSCVVGSGGGFTFCRIPLGTGTLLFSVKLCPKQSGGFLASTGIFCLSGLASGFLMGAY